MDTIEIKKLEHSELEITGELSADEFESYRPKALKYLGEHAKIDGFREGHVPADVLAKHVGEGRILEEMAEMALAGFYPKMLKEKKIEAIGRPEIVITKLAAQNPLGFKIKTATLPAFELPDYKKVAAALFKNKETFEVTDKEVQDTIDEIRKNWALRAVHQKEHDETGHVEGDGHKHDKKDVPEADLPELNDDFVKNLGKFETVFEFKEKLRLNLKEEKESKAREKKRIELIEKIGKDTKMDVPNILVESEQKKLLLQFQDNIQMMGLEMPAYLAQMKKTEEDITNEMRGEAEKRAKVQLILNKIAEVENITVSEGETANEVAKLLSYYQNADPERARGYVEQLLMNEKVFKSLESQE